MKKTTKLLSLLLVLIFCISAFSACKSGNEESVDDNSVVSGNDDADKEWLDENGNYTTGLTKEDLGDYKKTFTILCQGNNETTYQSVDFNVGDENTVTFYGTLMDDAVTERANQVEEKYGVKIIGLKEDDCITAARNESMAGTNSFDAMCIRFSELATLATEDRLVALNKLDNMNLEAPWWDEGANEAFTIGGNLYFTTGDISILNKITTMGMLFNKKLVEELDIENPYDLVREHKWTLDKVIELSKQVPDNPDEQIHGLLTAYNDCDDLYIALGGTYTEKDSNDIPYLTVGNSKNIQIGVKLLETLSDRGNFILFAQECQAPIWDTSFAEFYEGRAVFRVSGFSAANKMRDYQGVTFGIVPSPLFDENQEDYIAAAGLIAGVGILKAHENPEWVAKMLNITAAGGKTYCTQAYYEVCLKTRDARDDDSEEMLDIIFDNLYYDIGRIYDFGGTAAAIQKLCGERSTAYASTISSLQEAADVELEEKLTGLLD